MNTSTGHLTKNDTNQQLFEAAFNAPNNRTIVFTAVRDNEHKIIDCEYYCWKSISLGNEN